VAVARSTRGGAHEHGWPGVRKLSDSVRKTYLERIGLHRIGLPEGIADVVAFLASRASRYITGQGDRG
jgi:NAD(P)-dependent dehydrogenase (short-subunit alcohol dehydrogenase family)